ncbi:hypothetical protein CR513_44976, partial [Mucuna pruriens]
MEFAEEGGKSCSFTSIAKATNVKRRDGAYTRVSLLIIRDDTSTEHDDEPLMKPWIHIQHINHEKFNKTRASYKHESFNIIGIFYKSVQNKKIFCIISIKSDHKTNSKMMSSNHFVKIMIFFTTFFHQKHLNKIKNFDSKVDKVMFLGYFDTINAYRVFNSRTFVIEEFIHEKFNEGLVPK